MSTAEIEAYLSAALDQEACKDTLTAALVSRVSALCERGIAVITLIVCLENLCDDPGQINEDVIENVIEWMLAGRIGGAAIY